MRLTMLSIAFASVAAAALQPANAAESVDNCASIIASVPATITSSGVYCLDADLSDDNGSGITIEAPNVTLDCRGHALGRNNYNYGLGIYAKAEATRLVVRNCELRGFSYGMILYGGAVVEDNFVRNAGAEGIYVEGDGSIIRRNRVWDTGNHGGGNFAYGIAVFGDIDIINNDIDGVYATTGEGFDAIGIVANDGNEPGQTYVIRGNRIRNVVQDEGRSGFGISTNATGGLVIRDNIVFGSDLPNSFGIYCGYPVDTDIRGNDIYDYLYPVNGCTADSGNVIRP